jgi:hypothetical protein
VDIGEAPRHYQKPLLGPYGLGKQLFSGEAIDRCQAAGPRRAAPLHF